MQNSREMTLILCFYAYKISSAKSLLFQYEMHENLDKVYFDFYIISVVSKQIYKLMSIMKPEYLDYENDFDLEKQYKKDLADLFSLIKINLYDLIDKNLKQVFIKIYTNPQIDAKQITTVVLKLLNIIPKDLKMYLREGIIFNSLKILKSIGRKICKDTPTDWDLQLELNHQSFIHINILKDIFDAYKITEGDLEADSLQQLKALFGKSQLLIVLSSLETIFQCMIDKIHGKYR